MLYALCILIGLLIAAALVSAGWLALLRLALRLNLPTFCAGRWPRPVAIPVVMYHGVERHWFEREMLYLKANRYQTITADQLVDALSGCPVDLPERPIVLTFDDGHRSLYTDAFPVLKNLNFHGISFICPWWVRDDAPQPEDDTAHTFGQGCTWDQFRQMNDSGVIDVQAHTFAHQQIWTDGIVRGFVRPGDAARYMAPDDSDTPPRTPNPPLGWPVLTHASRFVHRPRFRPDLEPMRACADYVRDHGGTAFFSQPNWTQQLRDVLAAQPGVTCDGESIVVPGRWETPEQRDAALRDDLTRTRDMINDRLGKDVRHLCFPWNEADVTATVIAQQCGYRSAFRRIVSGRDICQVHDDPMHIVRFKSDRSFQTVRCLPGRGRHGPVRLLIATICTALRRRRNAPPRRPGQY